MRLSGGGGRVGTGDGVDARRVRVGLRRCLSPVPYARDARSHLVLLRLGDVVCGTFRTPEEFQVLARIVGSVV